MIIETNSDRDTFEFGKKLGEKAGPGSVYCLDGDLGTGKTVIAKGIAAGLGITEPVSSPTFTVIKEYNEGRLPFYHFDVYRIEDPVEMDEIGYEDYFYGSGVTVIEWSDMIEELIPENAVRIRLVKDMNKGFDYRKISIEGLPEAQN
ncbi:MAG: tRNA (adenosine(37)-N6)-threonylcarbamoyltransferase complex ATPase subunit type 1 TsaE [Lachnospiraceae bacterium]|nr:tRNA (adenosine(37)-N6)-threonylcarbamoyltransferase complex ATPase subunit type 1 TsaE [Lachnospiraceae bacterium]